MSSFAKEASIELINGAVQTVESIYQTFNFQLLGNADQLQKTIRESSLPEAEKNDLCSLVENMIKSPFRRQVGRLRAMSHSLTNLKKQIENIQGD